MGKLMLTKDPSHKGYFQDAKGQLYVFRFGGTPIKVDEYRDDKPTDYVEEKEVIVEQEEVIDHRKDANYEEDKKFLEVAEQDYQDRENDIKKFRKQYDDQMVNHLESRQRDLVHEINNTEERLSKKDKVEVRDKENSTDMKDLDEGFTVQEQTGNKVFLNGKEIKQDKDNKRKQNAEMKKSDLINEYKNAKTVSDDWFTEEARFIGMTDEEIADHIYERKGARAQDSSDNNIKRILAKKEKEKWEKKVEDYKKLINDPKADESDRIFAQKELKNVQFEADQFKRYEEEYSNRINNSGISDIKLKDMLNRLSKTDRLEKVKMLRELGLNYNTTQRSDQQLYMILLKELNKRLK